MSDPKQEDLKKAEQLRDEARFEEALELMRNLEKSGNLSPESNLDCQILKGELFFWLERYNEELEICEQVFQESQRIGTDLQSFDALIFKLFALINLNDYDKFQEGMLVAEKIFNSITKEPSKEFDRRKALFNLAIVERYNLKKELKKALELLMETLGFYEKSGDNIVISLIYQGISDLCGLMGDLKRAVVYAKKSLDLSEKLRNEILIAQSLSQISHILIFQGDLDRALEYGKRCLELKQISYTTKINNLSNIGDIYRLKGKLELALEYLKRGLAFAEEKDLKDSIAYSLWLIGQIYWMQGKLDLALEHLQRSLTLAEEMGFWSHMGGALFNLIVTTVEMGSLEQAHLYLQRLEQLSDQYKFKILSQMYRIMKAYILKTSTRTQDLGEATRLLKQIAEEEVIRHPLTHFALVILCDILLVELRITNDPEVLDEIKPIITQLAKTAEDQHSYLWLTNVNLLQAKLALIQMDIDQARKYFTQAQHIASWHGLQGLARMVSDEHDKLLEQLDKWETLKDVKAPISDRMELASIGMVIESMQGKQVEEVPKAENEQPIFLVIMTEDKKPLFSYTFTSESTFSEDNIDRLYNIINSLSDQILSDYTDRIKFLDFLVLFKTINSFIVCYAFMGQSYYADQKLLHFTDGIKKEPYIMNILNDTKNADKVIKNEEDPILEELTTVSFLGDPTKFRIPFKAYKGDEPFLFVSYAHTDKLQVYPIIDYLDKSGFNVWYDEGISASEEWMKSIVENINKCTAFLVFITPHIVDSRFVRREISYALNKNKQFYSVYLKNTKLPDELDFEISGIQSMKKYTMLDSEFFTKLKEVLSPVFFGKN